MRKEQFALFKPLVAGLRKDSVLSLLYNVWTYVRRLILLYVAMFMADLPNFQVAIFTGMSIFSMIYLLQSVPHKSSEEFKLALVNESFTLMIGYLFMAINGVCTRVEQYMAVDTVITRMLYVNWAINGLVLLTATYRSFKIKWHKCTYKRAMA